MRERTRLADISAHGLLDRAVVLDPVHPGCVPDRRIVHGRIPNYEVVVIVQFRSENEVANPSQRVGAAVTLGSGKQMKGRFELGESCVEIVFERLPQANLIGVRVVGTKHAAGESVEA